MCPLGSALAAEVVQAPDELDVLEPGQVLVHRRVLAGQTDPLAHLARLLDDVQPRHLRGAAVRAQERREDADGRRLASAVRAEEPVHRARLHAQVDALQRLHLSVLLAEAHRLDPVRVRHCPDASGGAMT